MRLWHPMDVPTVGESLRDEWVKVNHAIYLQGLTGVRFVIDECF